MGRRKDDPLLQAAKGFPGRRKGKVEKEIEAAAQAAEAMPATSDNPYPLPAEFKRAPAYWSRAIQIWGETSEVLKSAGRRRPGYRNALTRYCIWTQLYLASAEQVRKQVPNGGTTVKVKLGHGEYVYRTHPSIDFMAKAETALRLLDAEFGFTPMRDADLVKTESFNAGQGRLPLGGSATGQKPEQPTAAGSDPMDLMNSADSPPPGALPN
ncbi:P27 family phage terminase small subunit [Rhizobium halophytocola]|uniref:Phage terminase small subunit n=1 Tax=Rhizobium halophytocola TaxID=735519 RepID=A0ABS4DVF1_9HYPH|nr:P27 family phage terminase small subunit [Rhizobium halophytocola]MBP1849683.1 phage terminase small subunit [Rhizobium halophytocola]